MQSPNLTTATSARFIAGEDVLFFHPKHASWVLGKVKGLSSSASPARLRTSTPAAGSHFSYQVESCDPLMNVTGDTVQSVPEKDVEPWDLHNGRSVATLDDLLSLTHLHEGAIFRTLAERYFLDLIYTNIGQILVAVNPFNSQIPRYLPGQVQGYLKESGKMIDTSQQQQGQGGGSTPSSSQLVPHVWVQAHNTFVTLAQDRQNQSILISGESGAGKTEAAKAVLRYLTMIANVEGAEADRQGAEEIAAQVMATNPILESFGNAKTVRNNNSSRFGKLLRLRFRKDAPCLFQSAHTTSYLLEKSRVLTCGPGERTYHAFYLAFQSPDEYREQTLKFPKSAVSSRASCSSAYRTLAAGKVFENEEYSNEKDFGAVTSALRLVLDSADEVDTVWRVVSGILHLSNITIASQGEGSQVESASLATLQTAVELLISGTTEEDLRARETMIPLLQEELTTTQLVIQGTATKKLLPLHKANDTRDALCRGLYSALFDYLVSKCNSRCERRDATTATSTLEILLLDIFGFESFVVNSFEQLCINYTNETLQQHYNHAVFTKDLELCASEGVTLTGITCPDLTPTLQAVHAAFAALDDACSVNGTETQFVENVWKEIPRFAASLSRNPTQRDSFIVKHYAGDVTYAVAGWIEKNRDSLKPSLRTLFSQVALDSAVAATSGASFVAALLNPTLGSSAEGAALPEAAAAAAGKPNKKGPLTVSAFFKRQMLELMEVINATVPHWIRCIKPHMEKKPRMLHGEYTLRQLRCSGVLDTVKVRKAGYPVRFLHDAFLRTFRVLVVHYQLQEHSSLSSDAAATCKQLLAHVGLLTVPSAGAVGATTAAMAPAQMGRTMVFLKTDAFFALEQHRKAAVSRLIVLVQQCGRGMLRRIRLMQTKRALHIQRIGRGYLAHKLLARMWADVHAEELAEKQRAEDERRREAQALEKRRRLEQAARQKEAEVKWAIDFQNMLRDEIDDRAKLEACEAAERRSELVARGLGAIQQAKARQKLYDNANQLIVERSRTSVYLVAEEAEERSLLFQQFLRLYRIISFRQQLRQIMDEEHARRQELERELQELAQPLDLHHQRVLGEFLLQRNRLERERKRAQLTARQSIGTDGSAILPSRNHHVDVGPISTTLHASSLRYGGSPDVSNSALHYSPPRPATPIEIGIRVLVRSAAQIPPPTSVLSLRHSVGSSVYLGAGTVVHVMPRTGTDLQRRRMKPQTCNSNKAVAVRLDMTGEVRWFDGDDLDVSPV